MGAEVELLAATAFGLEAVVVRELAGMGMVGKAVSTGRVLFRGGAGAICAANLRLRAADRVLLRVGEFGAGDFGELFEGVRGLAWEEWLGRDACFPVSGRSVKSRLSSVPACQRIVKKAIVERLRAAHGVVELPETGARFGVEVSLLEDRATLTIDTSGAGLHKRGYRTSVGEAGLKETLAAGLVLLSAWRPGRALIDPFCGTGTICIEAALIGLNRAPGLKRRFDAEAWPALARSLWEEAREAARAGERGELEQPIAGYDIDEEALRFAGAHARKAGVAGAVRFERRDFLELASELEHGCIVTNPPYGARMGESEEVEALYRSFPTVLRRLPTWSHHVLTARADFERVVGQEATRRRKLFNAQIECTYYQFLGPKPPHMRRGRGEEAREGLVTALGGSEAGDGVGDGVGGSVGRPGGSAAARGGNRSEGAGGLGAGEAPAFGGLRERDEAELALFERTLVNCVRHRRRYAARGITCYRVYERDMPDVPLVIDRYEDRVHVFEHEREHGRTPAQHADWLDRCRDIVARVMGVEKVYMKTRLRQRGLRQHEKLGESGEFFTVREGGLSFLVNLADYTDTGLFLDHRATRGMVRREAKGRRFLNLFCYTGSFTVYAAAGGAAGTTSVDLSRTYLEWAKRNMSINGFTGFTGREHRYVRSDVAAFLRGHERGAHYDLAVVDPPTFSNSTATEEDWEVQRSHGEVLGLVMGLMSPGGVVYFSTNSRRFRLAEELGAFLPREISNRTVPEDFRNRRVHRCWRMVAGGG